MKSLKASFRVNIKKVINNLNAEEKRRQSEEVTKKLLALPQYQTCDRISIFLNMNDEIQTNDILKHAFKTNKTCFVPRYNSSNTQMDMVKLNSWDDYDSLPETRWKIKQPLLDEVREEALETGGLDLILIPGLAFNKKGHRLGRGRGYYDTYLSKCLKNQPKPPITVALAFKEQIVEEIPIEETDVPINIVLYSD